MNMRLFCRSVKTAEDLSDLKRVGSLVASWKADPFRGLQRDFYTDDKVYSVDVAHVWRKSWLFVGFESQVIKFEISVSARADPRRR